MASRLKPDMPDGLQRLFHHALVGILLLALGAAPMMVQTVAWGLMLVDYSQTTSFTTAVEMTLDGRHPCNLCRKVQKHEQGQQKPQAPPANRELIYFHEEAILHITPVATLSEDQKQGYDSPPLITRTLKPSVPPPRSDV